MHGIQTTWPKSLNHQNNPMLRPYNLKPVQLRRAAAQVPLNELSSALARLRSPSSGCCAASWVQYPEAWCLQFTAAFGVFIVWRKDLLSLAHGFINENGWGQMRALIRWTDKQPWRRSCLNLLRDPATNTLLTSACSRDLPLHMRAATAIRIQLKAAS